MKGVFSLVFTFCVTFVHATTYYIDPSGKDTNTGSISSPWKTLAYACSRVTMPGDIIHVNSGTYTETVQSKVALGVSIEGEGESSVISSLISKQYVTTIYLFSAIEGTEGNQHISNLKFDGNNLTAWSAISINARSNVSIHDLYIINFKNCGVIFNGTYSKTEPSKYSKGNSFYNNHVINCSDYVGDDKYGNGMGAILIGGQEEMLIYDNELIQTQRGPGDNGYLIKFSGNGYNKGIKIFNNTIIKAPYDGLTWDFAIELWNCRGGIEINNNTIIGSIDFGGISTTNGSYSYAVNFHHNTIGPKTLQTRAESGIIIERTQTGPFIIRNNYFRNLGHPLQFFPESNEIVENIYIYNNIFNGIGVLGKKNTGNGTWWAVIGEKTSIIRNIHFINNVFNAGSEGNPNNGILAPNIGKASNIVIRNNIIQGFAAYPIYAEGTGVSIDTISIENNIFFNNIANYSKFNQILITNNTTQNNIIANPLFVSSTDFHLLSSSPAIGKALKIAAIVTDYDGNLFKNPPSIGAFEYNSSPPVPIVPVYQGAVVEKVTPALLEMTFTVSLADSVPAASSFEVQVDGLKRAVNSIAISGNKVLLTLASPVIYGNVITVSYTQPVVSSLQSPSGGKVVNLVNQPVTNNLPDPGSPNEPPVVQVKSDPAYYSGFVGELDASGSSDPNGDLLSYEWVIPADIPVSSTTSQKIRFLAPVLIKSQVYEFILNVNDGRSTTQKNISIPILPFKPGYPLAKTSIIEASDFSPPDYPANINDGNLNTSWSANGDNQWLLFTLTVPFRLSHIQLGLIPDQKYESYFEIFASKDNVVWDPVLTKTSTCNFSGNLQFFDFPNERSFTEYSFVKLVGHGTAVSTLNTYSEVRLFGNIADLSGVKSNIFIFPNPATELINILFMEPPAESMSVKIYNSAGELCIQARIDSDVNSVQIPVNLKAGIYVVQVIMGSLIVFAEKLLVI